MKPAHPSPPENSSARLPLVALQALAAAARLGSFKLAAEELFRTPSAVSHQIRELELALGQPLFTRGHRSVTLTPAGRELARAVQRAFALMQGAFAAAHAAHAPLLGLSLAPGFAATYVLPRMAELQRRVPGWRIDLESTADRADLAGGRVQVAVRFGPKPQPARGSGVQARLLLADRSVVVGAPSWFTSRGRLRTELAQATLLSLAQHPRLWAQALRELGLRPQGPQVSFDSQGALMEAAEQGLGLALTPASVVRQRIERGALQQVSGVSFDNGWGYWLLTRPLGPLRLPVEAVAAWLEEAVQRAPSDR